ncbi:MAG: thioredoxin-dependent thiol peroxidase [Gaiellales bacterium]
MLSAGDPAPDFSLPADDGSTVGLADLKGRRAVIYFYPRDDTPGCTKQACALRDAQADFDAIGATIVGVSPDSPESHARFRDKYALGFRLLADQDHAVAEAFGAWGEKTNYGKTSMGIIRSAFVIDEDGKIVLAKYNVKPDATAPRALAALATGE